MWTNRMTRYFEDSRQPTRPTITPAAFAAVPMLNNAPAAFVPGPIAPAAQSQIYQIAHAAAVEAARAPDIDPEWFSP